MGEIDQRPIESGRGRALHSPRPARSRSWMLVAVGSSLMVGLLTTAPPAEAQQQSRVVELTLETMVDLALSNSFRVRQLNLSIDRTRYRLQAERARLRSRIDLNVSAPDFRAISESQYNSVLQRNEIVHENSRRFEAELSIRQPVILFGYPTNGYLSLNNRMYRYLQLEEDGDRDLRYYNRYFVRYTQPLFQPNGLKNDLEEAELDLEDVQLNFYDDVVDIVDDLSDDYFELFEAAYQEVINQAHVDNLAEGVAIAQQLAQADATRSVELQQMQVELANTEEQVQRSGSQFRLQAASLRSTLNLAQTDSITLLPVITVQPIDIDVAEATRYALELTPRMRQLNISYRENEIRLEDTKGRGGFRMDLAFSYGREMVDPLFSSIWEDPTNTYTIDVNAYLPIWDWGQRSARIASSRIGLDQTQLRSEQAESEIRSNVQSQVRNVEDFQDRTFAMEQNLQLASGLSQSTLDLYRDGSISALELLQSFQREADTANNILAAYLGWRRALLRIQQLTFFDFERGMPVLERFGVAAEMPDLGT